MAEFKIREVLNDEGYEIQIKVPCHWEICGTCRGDGKHSAHLGAITSSEWDEWDYEEQETYMSGGYDRTCEDCGGSGKILTEDYDKLPKEDRERLEKQDRDEYLYRQECEAERRAGC